MGQKPPEKINGKQQESERRVNSAWRKDKDKKKIPEEVVKG